MDMKVNIAMRYLYLRAVELDLVQQDLTRCHRHCYRRRCCRRALRGCLFLAQQGENEMEWAGSLEPSVLAPVE